MKSAVVEAEKAKLASAMASYAIDNSADHEQVILCLNKAGLRANADTPRGELEFVPYVGINNMHTTEKNCYIYSGRFHEVLVDRAVAAVKG